MLLLTERYTLQTRAAPCYKSLHPTLNSTFIAHYQQLITFDNPAARKTIIAHINSMDELLKRYQYLEPVEQIVMIRDNQVAVPLKNTNSVQIINLTTQVKRQINFEFTGNMQKIQLLYFPQRQLLCIKQVYPESIDYSKIHDTTITLSYLDISKQNPLALTSTHNNDETVCSSTVHKGNNSSLVILTQASSSAITLILHDIVQNKNKQKMRVRQVKIDQYPRVGPDFKVWEFKDNQLLMVLPAAVDGFVKIINIEDSGVRQPKVPIEPNDQNIEVLFFKGYTYILEGIHSNVKNQDGQGKYRCCLFNNKQQEVIFTRFQHEFHKTNQVCSYDPTFFLQVKPITMRKVTQIKKTRLVPVRQMYMQILLHIQDDFDDDLLMDMIYLLDQL